MITATAAAEHTASYGVNDTRAVVKVHVTGTPTFRKWRAEGRAPLWRIAAVDLFPGSDAEPDVFVVQVTARGDDYKSGKGMWISAGAAELPGYADAVAVAVAFVAPVEEPAADDPGHYCACRCPGACGCADMLSPESAQVLLVKHGIRDTVVTPDGVLLAWIPVWERGVRGTEKHVIPLRRGALLGWLGY